MAANGCVWLAFFCSDADDYEYTSAKYVRGMYAVRVTGRLPEEIEAKLEESNIKYRPRDLTDMD